MLTYKAPLNDIQFALKQSAIEADVDEDLTAAILSEAARFAEEVLSPLHAKGDEGCTLAGNTVSTPQGFKEAYKQFCEGGWPGLAQSESFGGQGLPVSLHMAVYEMWVSANLSWALYPTISWGAITTVEAHGSVEQKDLYLQGLIAGRYTGTMCLTESHAGSDLGLLRTKATPNADDGFFIDGTKIFISSGEHDLAENILHLTLARLPGAPKGNAGISLFLVPKFLPDGERNGVACSAIEEKMGLHGNATCVINFDGAKGYLLGEENKGLAAMFTFINESRIDVCLQAQGQIERAFQSSLAYAQERKQMRASPRVNAEDAADPIAAFPEVKRLLLMQKAFPQSSRLLSYRLAAILQSSRGAAPSVNDERVLGLLTPIAKGFITEVAQEATSAAIQIFGGHGFIKESGVEQLYRDVRITAIYEGTTAIQGLDLLNRKIYADKGETIRELLKDLSSQVDATASVDADIKALVQDALFRWSAITQDLLSWAAGDANKTNFVAHNYLMLCGYTLSAVYLLLAADSNGEDSDNAKTCAYYCQHILPRTAALCASISCQDDLNEFDFLKN